MKCRFCQTELQAELVDLGFSPPSNAYLSLLELSKPELYYPLRVKVCQACWLVQTEDYAAYDTLFDDQYAYMSSTSQSWVAHAKAYVDKIIPLAELDTNSFVVEVASNDGYLLQHFQAKNIPSLGVEPTKSTAEKAIKKGISVVGEFFSIELAQRLVDDYAKADVIVANNVIAHVPDINDFVFGLGVLLKSTGMITLEFPHLLNLIEKRQFDTIYHEHFSYFSLSVIRTIAEKHGLRVWDVEKLPTHGGSLRVYLCHDKFSKKPDGRVKKVIDEERCFGLLEIGIYKEFQKKIDNIKNSTLLFLLDEKLKDKRIVAYGAAAKGNTFLNYAGVKTDLIEFVCDAAESKQNKFLPGSHIPIVSPDVLKTEKVDWVIVLPWNLIDEIKSNLRCVSEMGGRFVTMIPELKIYE